MAPHPGRFPRCLVGLLVAWLASAAAGAAPVTDRWVSVGPPAATVHALAVAPTGAVYAGTARHGVYWSESAGAVWQAAPAPARFPGALEVTVDPGDPRALYARFEAELLYRRPNGTWEDRGPSGAPDAFAAAPSDPRRLYVATGSWFWVSRDRGRTWRESAPLPQVTVLRVDPRDADVVYAATEGGIFKSADGTATWRLLATDFASSPIVVRSFELHPTDPDVLLAGTGGAGNGVWRSTDGGETWTRLRPPTGNVDLVEAVAFDPTDPRRLYAGVVHVRPVGPPSGFVWSSRDGGATWRRTRFATAVLSLAVDPLTGRVFAGLEHEGVRASDDGGTTWRRASGGLQATAVFAVALDPHEAGGSWVAAPEVSLFHGAFPGLFASTDHGRSWRRRGPAAGDGASPLLGLVFDPARAGRLWALGLDELWRSDDGGATWRELGLLKLEPNSALDLAIDPHESDRILVVGSRRELVGDSAVDVPVLWRSTDGGDTWNRVEAFDVPQPSESGRALTSVAFHPRRPGTVYAVGATGLFRSRDGGERWMRVSPPLGCADQLVVDPFRPSTLYLAGCGHDQAVLRSTDGGAHWQTSLRLAGGVSFVRALVADPRRAGTLYAGGDEGVFVTDDRGATWRPLSEGLPTRRVISLAVDPHGGGQVFAGTAVGGLFRLTRSN